MRRAIHSLILLSLLAAAVAALWYATRPQPVEVRLAEVGTGTVETIVANTRSGTVKPCRRARLAPSIGGQIAELPVSEGQRVEQGQLLLALWSEDLAASLQLARGEAAAAASKVEAACLRTAQAEREAARLEKLYKRGVASVDAVDQARTEASALVADCAAARALVQVREAQVELAAARLSQTRLLAPFAGVVAEVTGELHEYVTPSPPGIPTPPAVDLIDDQCFYVSAPIDEVDAPRVAVGQPARVALDAFGKHRFAGRVRRIAPYVLDFEKQARTVEIEVEFSDPASRSPNDPTAGSTAGSTSDPAAGANGAPDQRNAPPRRMLAGYSADVEVIVARRDAVARLPTEALMEDDQVYRYEPGGDDSGRLRRLTIDTGLSNWQWTEVSGGLAAGDRVVTSLAEEGLADGVSAAPAAAGQAPSQ